MSNCKCYLCKNNWDFDFPKEIIDYIISRKIVLFAGAGISTENKSVRPFTFYDEVNLEFDENDIPENLEFPDLMEKFCLKPNGRRELIKKIINRFSTIDSFPETYTISTKFHQTLSTIPFFETIITTNWDIYFEQECCARPFITGEDLALWDVPGRKIIKIHGSINNLGSLIITRSDYDKCYKNLVNGLIGAKLKSIIGGNSILFVGYSLKDNDFIKIYEYLRNEMGNLFPTSYIVTLDRESDKRFRDLGLIPIYTSGYFFI